MDKKGGNDYSSEIPSNSNFTISALSGYVLVLVFLPFNSLEGHGSKGSDKAPQITANLLWKMLEICNAPKGIGRDISHPLATSNDPLLSDYNHQSSNEVHAGVPRSSNEVESTSDKEEQGKYLYIVQSKPLVAHVQPVHIQYRETIPTKTFIALSGQRCRSSLPF